LLHCRFFFGVLACGLALGAPIDVIRVAELCRVAGHAQSATRRGLCRYFGAQGSASPKFVLGPCVQLGLGASPPFTDSCQLAYAHRSFVEAGLLGARQLLDPSLAALPRDLSPSFFGACPSGASHTLGDPRGLAVDTLVAQPAERLERITMPHERPV
jgi:hypothetical protein